MASDFNDFVYLPFNYYEEVEEDAVYYPDSLQIHFMGLIYHLSDHIPLDTEECYLILDHTLDESDEYVFSGAMNIQCNHYRSEFDGPYGKMTPLYAHTNEQDTYLIAQRSEREP